MILFIKFFDNFLLKSSFIFFEVLIIFLVIFYFKDSLLVIKSILDYFNIQSTSIDKQLLLIKLDDISNNRVELWLAAIESIKQYPLFGIGISQFELNIGIYSHNIILQIFIDFGIVFSFILIFIILYGFTFSLNFSLLNTDKFFIFYLFSSSVPILFFSSVIWYFPTFWLFLFYSIRIIYLKLNHF
jgi:hypothetical protein